MESLKLHFSTSIKSDDLTSTEVGERFLEQFYHNETATLNFCWTIAPRAQIRSVEKALERRVFQNLEKS